MATATTGAHTGAQGGPKGVFPPFNKETFGSQLLWFAIAFAALYLLLARVALPRLAAIMEARRARLDADIEAAGKLTAKSEAAIEAYEKALAEARAKAQTIAAEARRDLMAKAEERKKKLEAGLAAKLAEAERQIEATKAAAMAHVRGIAADTAGAIVEQIVGKAPGKAAAERAVDAALH
jgi:F-type H+-transporting ATPase subunit b